MALTDTDVDALTGVIAVLEDTQRREDVDGFLALFRDDAIWTTSGGRRLTGLEEIAAFTRQVLPGAFPVGETVDYEVVHILLIRPDAAAVKVRQQYRNLAGEATDGEGSPMYVMSKEAGRWVITAAQNTAVSDVDVVVAHRH